MPASDREGVKIINGVDWHKPEEDFSVRASMRKYITFEQLPLRPDDPPYSAWGLWGNTDEIGALNQLTSDVVKDALKEVLLGVSIPLNLPLSCPHRPMNPVRKACVHRIIAKGRANDDELDINTQGSSHFDGLRHIPYQDGLRYYNGTRQGDITPGAEANSSIGIHNAAQRGIAGRGVLLDWYRYALANNIAVDAFSSQEISLDELLAVARYQDTSFKHGDILLLRTGWLVQYRRMPISTALALPDGPRAFIGVEPSVEMMKWHWDNGFSAVATDTVAYEVAPLKGRDGTEGLCLHEVFLSGWGMMIGESWDLERLSEECEKQGKWTFFLTSCPLNVEGGIASPSNAMAIL